MPSAEVPDMRPITYKLALLNFAEKTDLNFLLTL
jgi:hypothetical protein